jgi:hypothetical protein
MFNKIKNRFKGYKELKDSDSPRVAPSRDFSSKSKVSTPTSAKSRRTLVSIPSSNPSSNSVPMLYNNDIRLAPPNVSHRAPPNAPTDAPPDAPHDDSLNASTRASRSASRSASLNASTRASTIRSDESGASIIRSDPSDGSDASVRFNDPSDDTPNNFIKYAPNFVLNSFIEQINNFYKEIKNFFNEIDIYDFIYIFLITIIIIVLILLFIWHSIYYKAMKNNSCMENKNLKDLKVFGQGTSIHNKNNIKDLYSIHYTKDLKSNSYKEPYIQCECPKGNIVNKFTAIPYYYNDQNKVKDKVCECDDKYEENLIYRGNSGLKRYMNNQENTNIFKI